MGAMGGALLGMVSDQVTGSQNRSFGRESAEKQYRNQRKLNEQGQQLALDTWNKTNAEAQMQHYKNAGLNANMMYGGTGGGGATTSSGSGGSAGQASAVQGNSATGAGIGSMSQMGMMKAQEDVLKAQKDNLDANTNKTNVEASNIEEPIVAGVGKTLAEKQATELQNEKNKDTLGEQKEQITSESVKARNEATVSTNTIQASIDKIKSESIGAGLENILTRAKTENTYQDTQNLKQAIRKMQADIAQGWEKLSIEERTNKLRQFAEELKAEYPNAGQAIGRSINEVYNYLMEISGTPTNAKTVDSKEQW